jgi:lipopolysaccharide heptosyltransferase I
MPADLSTLCPRRILIIKPSAIGDIVHALPVLNLVRRRWPAAHIAWMVTPACAGLLDGHPQLDEVIRFERRRFGQSWRDPGAALGLWKFARELKARQFDLVVDLQGLFRSGWLSGQTKAPVRVGFANAREFGWLYYTHRVPVPEVDRHATDRYLDIAEALGCPRSPVEYVFATTDEDRAFVRSAVAPLGGRYAVVIPGTNWETKRWPVEKYARLVTPLLERHNLRTVAAGSPDEVQLAAQVNADLNLAGKTHLRQLVALLEGADVVVANDSGPMHIAAALGKPLVTLYGPTNPVRTGPYLRDDAVLRLDIPCSPCYSRKCSHTSCLNLLESDRVLEAVQLQVSAKGKREVAADQRG